jgi:DNA-binding CsgD family transcriptional regulator
VRGFISTNSAHMLDYIAQKDAEKRQVDILKYQLTPREREVVTLVAQGLPNIQIGRRLGISSHTAHFHVSNILFKLGVERRTGIAAFAIRSGLA